MLKKMLLGAAALGLVALAPLTMVATPAQASSFSIEIGNRWDRGHHYGHRYDRHRHYGYHDRYHHDRRYHAYRHHDYHRDRYSNSWAHRYYRNWW
ncbi:hypothetical protein [Methyloligella solikamskensis]|uniref:Uncharacterized protein n=1 Tax=Methyloligella solikamskensis TaxID=1177756 RepID=A0ABW3JDP7_9HYPH